MKVSSVGIELIKEFEGLYLDAYPDPGTGGEPITIGYGHTGGVELGESVTEEEAEDLLIGDLVNAERAIKDLIEVPLSQDEFDALVSFTFNVGSGALRDSTLRRRLNAGEPKAQVFREELPRWNKGGNGVMPGLVRRRAAEVELATRSPSEAPESFLEKAATYYVAEPHQTAAWRALEASLTDAQLEIFKAMFRGEVIEHAPALDPFPLDAPYFGQYDSRTNLGGRMCFTSSMAMAIEYLDPEAIEGDDDDYLRIVLQYGDTVSSGAQIKAARSVGMDCEFLMDGNVEDLEAQLDKGLPVPVGILHHGHVSRPSGGGHWICLIGYDDTHFMVNDPAGELDLVNGGYGRPGVGGGNQRYSRENLMKRWNIEGDSDGWYVKFR